MTENLKNAKEASGLIGISTDTLARWRMERKHIPFANMGFRSYDRLAADVVNGTGIPMHKFGSSVRYLGKDVIAYIEAYRVDESA